MDKTDNLIPLNKRSKEEAKAIQKMGGVARGQQRTEEKHGRALLRILLGMDEKDQRILNEIRQAGIDIEHVSREVAMHSRQIDKAIKKADTYAYQTVLKAAGLIDEKEGGTTVNNYIVRNEEEARKLQSIGNLAK